MVTGTRRVGWLGWQERVARLPRDTRDTLFNIAVVAWTIAPHLLHLSWWCSAMSIGLLMWRARLAVTGASLPGRWTITALLMLAASLTYWTEGTLLGKEAGITMLAVLMGLKTLELRSRRDALVIFFLGFFLVLTNFLYSQSLITGLWLLVAVWGLLSALALSHMPVGRPPLWAAGGVALRAALWGVPLMALLFVLFPRIGPLWGLPQDAAGRTGLSGSMRLGGVASIAEDNSIALRIRFLDRVPQPEQMYFRGPVLAAFDGNEWTRYAPSFPVELRPRLDLEVSGQAIRYEMTVEASRLPLLPLLEISPDKNAVHSPDSKPAGKPQGKANRSSMQEPSIEGYLLTLRPDAQWQLDRPLGERVRVQASAYLAHRHGPRQEVVGLRDLLQLPTNRNPRTLAWARELRARPGLANADANTLAAAVLQHIREGGYIYTMEPGTYEGNAIDEFWLDRKLGFCEHFASAFVVVMRAMDVPARIVTGYQGTDNELQDGFHIVRQRNAHAWAEVWQAGVGWQRVDPTNAVAPERVQSGRRLNPNPGFVDATFNTISPALARTIRNAIETINNRWNQWVLNYSRGQQFDLMKTLGFGNPSWQDLTTVLIGVLCSVSLAGAAWAWWDRQRQDPWQRLQRRVQARLLKLGVTVQAHHAPRTRAVMVRQALGQRGEALAANLEALDRSRYAGGGPARRPDHAWWRGFDMAARALR
jgi:protein-glutamine gamma-glutamyltransferase